MPVCRSTSPRSVPTSPRCAGGTAFFDGPGGSQTPDVVARAVADTLTSAISNRGTVTAAERRADAVVGEFRSAFADLLGADPGGVVFGRSATSLTYDLGRALAKHWGPGDEVVVTRLDHDSNVRPWVQLAEAAGATVRWVDFDPATGELSAEAVAAAVGGRTRLVATTAASNLIGTRPPTRRISELAHAVGALHWVDGVHATAHASVDLARPGGRRVDLLAVQVHGAALRRARRRPGAARDPPPRQAAALDGCRAGAVRARHPPLRAAGGSDGDRRLHRRPGRPRRRRIGIHRDIHHALQHRIRPPSTRDTARPPAAASGSSWR